MPFSLWSASWSASGPGSGVLRCLVWALIASCTGSPHPDPGPGSARVVPPDGGPPSCRFTSPPEVIRQDGAAVLVLWELPHDPVFGSHTLPEDSSYAAYRAAFRLPDAALRTPPLHVPLDSEVPAEVWEAERANNRVVYAGNAGVIEPITCLDALLFSFQNARVPQLEVPTEFVASVLRREGGGRRGLAVVLGASDRLFPPRSVHGLEVVDRYLEEGWDYWYLLHNHTIQEGGEQDLPGVPVPSTSDVQAARALVAARSLQSVRVTNGFYTSILQAHELAHLRGR